MSLDASNRASPEREVFAPRAVGYRLSLPESAMPTFNPQRGFGEFGNSNLWLPNSSPADRRQQVAVGPADRRQQVAVGPADRCVKSAAGVFHFGVKCGIIYPWRIRQ